MKRTKVIYWIFTILLAALMLLSGITNALVTKESVELVSNHLGYPTYIIAFLGWAKVLGVVALLIPGFPRLKEWAYAGFTFDLAGALFSSIAVGDPVSIWWPILIGFLVIAGSYIFYHKKINYKP
ncbi:MAG: DoxX-like family protein [Chitinophagaceae bacterium]|nr:DoxX-like family protein [Chitinophagaceae bacterium]